MFPQHGLKEPNAWFVDLLAQTSTWIVAKEAVEKFGDLKKAEAVVGTGPWMLERYDAGAKLVYVRNPHYFVPGLPYADGVEVVISPDPASAFADFITGKLDVGPEYGAVVRRIDLDVAKQAYYLFNASVSAVGAWQPYVKNFSPNIGHDIGGRLTAAWLDR
ncbi:MAG: hypothetical protein HYR51_01770 [Candidatus Rokubacteria bacterium]|nr:hypothetical protein [Candidatus Rokubacteria bacterium]